MSKTWITSDFHFGHTNIIKFCNRKFQNVELMDQALIAEWRSTIGVDDIVYFLGDLTLNHRKESALTYLTQLTGKLKIVPGNHDKVLRKIHRDEPGVWFEMLPEIVEVVHNNERFVLSHFPIEEWNHSFHAVRHLHGHCHATRGFKSGENRWDVGWDSQQRIFNFNEFVKPNDPS